MAPFSPGALPPPARHATWSRDRVADSSEPKSPSRPNRQPLPRPSQNDPCEPLPRPAETHARVSHPLGQLSQPFGFEQPRADALVSDRLVWVGRTWEHICCSDSWPLLEDSINRCTHLRIFDIARSKWVPMIIFGGFFVLLGSIIPKQTVWVMRP